MTLKAVVDTLDSVPEGARDLYAERDGKFHLTVEGLVPASKVTEFRDNNIALAKTVEDLTKKFEGIDPEAVRQMQEHQRKIRDKELVDAGKIEELFAERINPMKLAHEKDLSASKTEAATLKAQLESLLIDGAIRDAAGKAGVRATAIDDVLLRGRSAFKIVEGKAVPMEGEKVMFGKNGDAMSVGEWIDGLTDRAPHLFDPSQGAGSRAANPNLGGGGARVSRTDTKAFLQNIDGIAGGTVKVV